VWSFLSGPTCIYSEKPRDILAEIAAGIEHEFQNSPVAPATVGSQPGPNTLRGAETNLYAQATEQAFDLDLLGQKVHITATPIAYVWDYGDGIALGPTPNSGAQLPQDRWGEKTLTSHIYTHTGNFTVTVATHFRGTYSVNGGAPLAIPGHGTFNSALLPVSVWRTVTKTYADDCLQNPQGEGCGNAP
ncbi:PKD domain-containing protein, partial [Arthrobacter terrae]|uniref:PKD domain-containing protein n=1 Tax=Arthrobacter terrae TaxID=2935737 RepID=UPI001E2EA661